MRTAVQRVGTILVLGVLPVVTAIAMFAVASSDDSLSVDFQNELYPEAERLLHFENPFPPPGTDLSHGHNLIWPPIAALVAAPFTILSPAAANWAIALVGLACFMGSLRLVGVRDWRVYGVFALWPQVIGEIRVSHLTPFLCLLLALAWRYRDARGRPGLTVGTATAIKFFLWPLGVWLAATGRAREALLAGGVALSSLLLVLPFTSLHDYVAVLLELGRTFGSDSYSPFGLLSQIGMTETPARIVTIALGLVLLVGCWRRASLGLAVAAALVLSPIVWLDYYAVAAIPLAVVRPRLSPIWFAPLVTWGLLNAGIGAATVGGGLRVLVAFALVILVTVRGERRPDASGEDQRLATVGPAPTARLDPKTGSG